MSIIECLSMALYIKQSNEKFGKLRNFISKIVNCIPYYNRFTKVLRAKCTEPLRRIKVGKGVTLFT